MCDDDGGVENEITRVQLLCNGLVLRIERLLMNACVFTYVLL